MTLFYILTFLFIAVSAAMMLIILVQRPQGGGLAGAFGGAGGGTDSVFGGRVGDALTWATIVTFGIYLVLAVGLNLAPTTPAPSTIEQAGEAATGTDTSGMGEDGATNDTGGGTSGTGAPEPAPEEPGQ